MKKVLTVLIGLLILLVPAGAAWAGTDVVLGGDFQLKLISAPDDGNSDATDLCWWEFNVTSYKDFGDHGKAYMKLRVDQDSAMNSSAEAYLYGFGYTYKVNDKLSFTGRVDRDGERLADSFAILNGCDWNYDYKRVNLKNHVFVSRTALKMDATPLPGLNLTLAYAPQGYTHLKNGEKTAETDDYASKNFPEQYLVKAKYNAEWFNIGGGWTNTRDGYVENEGNFRQYRPLYDIYGEIFPNEKYKLYWEYMDGDAYLTKGTIRFDPYTLKMTYGNIGYKRVGYTTYKAYSLDAELEYALSENKRLIGGLAYYIDNNPEFATATVGYAIGPLTAKAQRDFDLAETSLIAKCNLDGTNELEATYNFDKNQASLSLYIYFW
jgi:hypothetical protein